MAKFDKNFNIPRGEDEYAAIRDKLKQRIREYEGASLEKGSTPRTQQEKSQKINWDKIQNSNGQRQVPFTLKNQEGNHLRNQGDMSFQQYQQNLNAGMHEPSLHGFEEHAISNQPSNTSPFVMPHGNNVSFQNTQNAVQAASHSKEPVTYKPKQRKSAGKTFLFLILLIAIILGLSWGLREFVFQAYEIPSGSMEKTIMTGDMVFAEKVSYKLGAPKPGDIVTFNDPLNDGRILIKRVIATEGQVVDIKNNKLYINGIEQYEDYVGGLPTTTLRSSSVKYPYVVPQGQVWVMGDNRTNSQDSRYFGSVPVDSVIGQALVVYWPVSNAKNLV